MGSDQWFEFNDKQVRRVDINRVKEHYGGVPESANAYMLVYIRDSDREEILCGVEKEDIPEEVILRVNKEQEEKEKKKKEEEELPQQNLSGLSMEPLSDLHQATQVPDEAGIVRSSVRTRRTDMDSLSPEYCDGDFIVMDLENPATFIKDDSVIPDRQGFEPPKDPKFYVATVDASGIGSSLDFAVGFAIRDKDGLNPKVGLAGARFPDHKEGEGSDQMDFCEDVEWEDELDSWKNPLTTLYMELTAADILLWAVDPKDFPWLIVRCDNKKAVEVLERILGNDTFEEILHTRRRTNDRVQLLALMASIRKNLEKYRGPDRQVIFEWIVREANYVADRLSHIARTLPPRVVLFPVALNDWTLDQFFLRDVGIGFCFFSKPPGLCFRCRKPGHMILFCPHNEQKGYRCIVRGLPPSVDNGILRDLFDGFGKLIECIVCLDRNKQSKGFGFIGYLHKGSREAAVRDMHKKAYNGSTIQVIKANETLEEHFKAIQRRTPIVMKPKERIVEIDESLRSMKKLVKKEPEVYVQMGSDRASGKQKLAADRDSKVEKKKALSLDLFRGQQVHGDGGRGKTGHGGRPAVGRGERGHGGSLVGLLQDDVDPVVSVTKVEKAPLESYADIGGLDARAVEIKEEAIELPIAHPCAGNR
ncbi:hypothetical protein MKX03_013637 [Papaver bracteatum]|nr:hypothetical protein MKX03_013637 [Papaver bracteatum]